GKNGSYKLRIDITKPAKTIVINGDQVKFYEPDLHQLLKASLKDSNAKKNSVGSLAITFGSVSSIRAAYNIDYVGEEKVAGEDTSKLKLTPKKAGPYKEIHIWVSHKLGLPIQQRLVEVNDDVIEVRLSDVKKDIPVDTKKLIDNFNPPATNK
ncbi:MAG: outer-membrane lipoprotein carrier protein LolA, partial [Acidobacteriota bacterium]